MSNFWASTVWLEVQDSGWELHGKKELRRRVYGSGPGPLLKDNLSHSNSVQEGLGYRL